MHNIQLEKIPEKVNKLTKGFTIFVEFESPSQEYFYKYYKDGENCGQTFIDVYEQYKDNPHFAGIKLKQFILE